MTALRTFSWPRLTGPCRDARDVFDEAMVKEAYVGQDDRDKSDDSAGRKWAIQTAKAICKTCHEETRVACLTLALDEGDRWGIYGGTTPAERQELMR